MKLIVLHDINNPDRVLPMDAEDFSAAQPYLGGALVYRKDSDTPLTVYETPEKVLEIIQGTQGE